MLKLGFAEPWIKQNWNYISLVSFSVLINGGPSVEVSPQKGLR